MRLLVFPAPGTGRRIPIGIDVAIQPAGDHAKILLVFMVSLVELLGYGDTPCCN